MRFDSPLSVKNAINHGRSVGSELELHFSVSAGRAYTTIPAHDFAALLRLSRGSLRRIRMYHVGLEGDLEPVLQAVRELKNLRGFLAQCCRFHPGQMSDAVSGLQWLESLILVGHYGGDVRIRMTEITQLLRRNQNLQILELNPMGSFSDLEDAADFFDAVKRSTSLNTLWCLSKFTGPYLELVGDMIGENGSLESFKVSVAQGASLVPIAEGLKGNVTCKELDVQCDKQPTIPDFECFEKVLKEDNVTLKHLTVSSKKRWCDETRKHIPQYHGNEVKLAAERLDFYMSLNRNGRQKLLHDNSHEATPEDWLDAIADNKNLSEIFYWGRRNPFLCLPRSLGGIIPKPTPQSMAKEKARQAAKYSSLYSFGGMELRGLKSVEAALEDPNPRPVSKLTFHFPHGVPGNPSPKLQASDLAAIIRRQPQTLTSLMFYFVKIEGDFQQVLEAIRERKSFQYFFAQGSTFDANGLVRVLSDIPSFQSLTLTWCNVSIANLTALLRKRSMKSLLVSGAPPATDQELSDYFEAAEQSPELEKLHCIMREKYMTTTQLSFMGTFLRNHNGIAHVEIRVARNASLLPLAQALEHNKSLTRLTITIDGIDGINPTINRADIVAFRDVLATKNSTLKFLKVCKESWHGDHLWKPQYGRGDETKSILGEIETFILQNSKGRLLPTPVPVQTNTRREGGLLPIPAPVQTTTQREGTAKAEVQKSMARELEEARLKCDSLELKVQELTSARTKDKTEIQELRGRVMDRK